MKIDVPGLEYSTVEMPDGASLALRVLPAGATAPVVLILPAMAIKAKFYLPLMKALQEAGLSAATVDLRAQGDSTPALGQGPDFGYRELIETDLPAVTDAVTKRFPGVPLHLFGHSLGGQLALLFSAAEPERVTSVTTIGTGSVYWRSFPAGRWAEMLATARYVDLVTRLRGRWPGGGGIGPMTAGVMLDWARYARTGRFRPRRSTRDYDGLLRALSLPYLAISLEADRLGPESTVRFLCGRLPSANITRWHVDESSGLRHIGHAAWIKDSDILAPVVAAWITDGTPPR
ncbi:alpha/beta hydrolase family protein [Amycolatopsis pithecellobii]|uniref:Alpha/beta fold hydrolase n=1 Tax=Amycolatopsis pithecellobii TaxID=664692 RepID=A0A6N7Z8P3_9PSEU|nr:alpha/beta fold hydrolase [Amycolatopsis pithecellobii]MTD58224.1 alpha/beta fold hydrolase [Amycolatopsis pithecellobii]